MNRNLRWRIFCILCVLLICVYYVYPTLRWAGLTPDERLDLEKEWERSDPKMEEESLPGRILYSLDKWARGDPSRVLNLGLDLKGGMHVVLQVETKGLSEDAKRDAVQRAVEIIRNRVDEFGVAEPSIFPEGRDRIVVQLPGIEDPQRALKLIGRTALLEFKLVAEDNLTEKVLERINAKKPILANIVEDHGSTMEGVGFTVWKIPENRLPMVQAILNSTDIRELIPKDYKFLYGRLLPDPKLKTKVKDLWLVRKETVIKGISLRNAQLGRGRMFQSIVNLDFDRDGMRKLRIVSGEAEKKYKDPKRPMVTRLAIVLDDVVYSAPLMKVRLDSSPYIEGNFSVEDANDLAIVLRAGALPAPVKIAENRTVGPSLGRDSIVKGVRAALFGLAIVILFMAIYYLRCGVIADFALLLNLIIVIAVLSMFRATLTLPGIAGIILTIGMSVDANVLIFERIREETALGRRVRAAISNGYSKAFVTILDANLTTLITALILFWFGTGPVRGFAVTLSVGIIGSMFTALFVTRTIFVIMGLRESFTKLTMLQVIGKTKIDFLGKKGIAFFISIVVIGVGLFSFFQKGWKNNFGIDFSGGSLQQFAFEKTVSLARIRGILKEADIPGSMIQHIESNREIIVKTPEDQSREMLQLFKKELPGNPALLLRSETVGPAVGKALRQQAFLAIILAMIAIILYISWRFRHFQFGVAAVIALAHDVLVTIGCFAITGREINLPIIAALLTIVGYSLNDTIVVFDRIREDLRLMKKASFRDVINISINQTLSRTLLTSLTTFVVVLSLFVFGGGVIHDFAFALMVGIIVGTYSSIFIASPVLILWPGQRPSSSY
jgi:SecD/SecF fusion protein